MYIRKFYAHKTLYENILKKKIITFLILWHYYLLVLMINLVNLIILNITYCTYVIVNQI